MAFSTQSAVSDGTLVTLLLTINYIDQPDVTVFVDDVEQVVDVDYEWTTDSSITFLGGALADGVSVLLARRTQLEHVLNIFAQGATFNNATMDENFQQLLYVGQEAQEGSSLTDVFNDVDMHGNTLLNLAPAVAPNSPVTLAQLNSYAADSAAVLRADLALGGGAGLIGYGGETVANALDTLDLESAITPLRFGATGDGVTLDNAAFAQCEASQPKVIDLAGRSYALSSVWVDPVNGVLLTKDYKNGTIFMDGRLYVQDLTRGLAESGAVPLSLPESTRSLGLFRKSENQYLVWLPMVGRYWAEIEVSRLSTGVPFNWQGTYFKQVLGYIPARSTGTHVYTGSWATDTASTALESQSSTAYLDGRAQQSITQGDYVEITYSGGGDIFVIFTGRNSGDFVNVLLNGSQDFLTLPRDGSGNAYFDSYTSVDLQHRQVVQIASGVPDGNHTIRLTNSTNKNPASTGGRYVHNALSFLGKDTGPWLPSTDAPKWASGQTVLKSQVRKWLGNYYYAAADGTTGANPPVHTSGSVSDGGVTWVHRAESGYELPSHQFQAAGSQLEYAYEIKPAGAASKEDVGGRLHGNETQTSASWRAGAAYITLEDNSWAVGDSIGIKETIDVTHSEIGGGSTVIVNTVLNRDFNKSGATVRHRHSLLLDAELGYFYSHMWPLLHYSAAQQKYGVTKVYSPGDGYRKPEDFYSQNNPLVGRTKDFIIQASGPAFQPNGSGGVPSTVASPLEARFALKVSPSSVAYYPEGNRIFASKAMNTSGADVSSGGFSSMTSKMYFERHSSQNPASYSAGSTIDCEAFYGLSLLQNGFS